MNKNAVLSAITITLFAATSASAEDWPQWLGPNRDGVSTETGLSTAWPDKGPRQLWQRDVGEGYAGPVIAGNRLILFHRIGNKEVVECLDPANGKKQWEYSYATSFDDAFGKGKGPRSTPVIHGQRVITLGADGMLLCLDLKTGKKIWDRRLLADYKVPASYFGIGTSPIIEKELVLINVGARDAGIVAFALETGKEVWKATQDPASYSSPVCCTIGGARLGVFFTRTGVVLLDPADGKVRFQKRFRARIDASVNAATPLIIGDLAFFSASYETGALLLNLRPDGADEVWAGDDIMSNHYNTCVHHDGYLYGFDGRQEAGPRFRCVELKTGKVQWTKENFGCGSMILVQGHVLMLTEQGELMLVEASPKAYREKARSRVFEAVPCRAQIALAEGKLFARDQGKLACWNLK
jgi:outer membrane protein assembly factor BamB